MQLTVDKINNVTVVTVHLDEFDASNAEEFKRQIAPVLQTSSKLVLDLSRVKFVDSSGCGAILSCLKNLTQTGGDLKLRQGPPRVRTTFEVFRLHRLCATCHTSEHALPAF